MQYGSIMNNKVQHKSTFFAEVETYSTHVHVDAFLLRIEPPGVNLCLHNSSVFKEFVSSQWKSNWKHQVWNSLCILSVHLVRGFAVLILLCYFHFCSWQIRVKSPLSLKSKIRGCTFLMKLTKVQIQLAKLCLQDFSCCHLTITNVLSYYENVMYLTRPQLKPSAVSCLKDKHNKPKWSWRLNWLNWNWQKR